jgi:putative peptidoglycan lipid II flippase
MIMSSQLAGIVQSNVASQATGDASLQVLRLSWLIVMLPHSLVTVSIGTAYFTRMSGHVRDGDTTALRSDISTSMRTIGMLIVFATTGLMVLAYPFSSLFSTTGFSGTVAMGNVLIAFLPGLIPLGVLFITQRTFFAFEQTRLTFFIQFFQSALFVIGALLVSLWPTATIGIGIAIVMSVTTGLQTLLSLVILRRRLSGIDARRVVRQYSLFLLAAIPSTVVGVLIVGALGAFSGGFAVSGFVNAAVAIVAAGFGMLAVYVAALYLLRSPEIVSFVAPVLSRLARRS